MIFGKKYGGGGINGGNGMPYEHLPEGFPDLKSPGLFDILFVKKTAAAREEAEEDTEGPQNPAMQVGKEIGTRRSSHK